MLGPGQVITDYSVQYRRRGNSSYSTCSVAGSSTTSYNIVNLNPGTVYEVTVASVGPLGLSGYCCGSGKEVTAYSVGVQQCSYSTNCLYTFCERSTINDPYDWCRDNLHLYTARLSKPHTKIYWNGINAIPQYNYIPVYSYVITFI